MVESQEQKKKCATCQEIHGNIWVGYVYCAWLNCDVWADSLRCQHGLDLDEMF